MQLSPRILEGQIVRLEPFTPALKEELRAALDVDPDTWWILASTGQGEAFDAWWDQAMAQTGKGTRIGHAVRRLSDGVLIGTSSYLAIHAEDCAVEIGSTFYRPEARGAAVNPECKLLMLRHAFELGALRVQFMVDARNARSQAAVLKLGAVKEGVIRAHMFTWTGHRRDTAVFSILADEWPGVRAGLEARLAAA